jgi:hypothetical protein
MDLLREPFRWPRGSSGTVPSASPSTAGLEGYPRCHWTPPSGEYLPRIAPADTMVSNFGVINRVVALWKSLSEASVKNARNGPSTQLTEATSCVER